jgi:hypothetical protein
VNSDQNENPLTGQHARKEELGNVSTGTDLTYSFGPAASFTPSSKAVAFQAVVEFVRPSDGAKLLRVITRQLPITNEPKESWSKGNTGAIVLRALHGSAAMAQNGDYFNARMNLTQHQRLLQNIIKTSEHQKHYIRYIQLAERLDGFMREAQQQENIFGANNASRRRVQRDDSAAKNVIQMKYLSYADVE